MCREERATYSYKAIYECIEKIKTLNTTVSVRSQHGNRIFKV